MSTISPQKTVPDLTSMKAPENSTQEMPKIAEIPKIAFLLSGVAASLFLSIKAASSAAENLLNVTHGWEALSGQYGPMCHGVNPFKGDETIAWFGLSALSIASMTFFSNIWQKTDTQTPICEKKPLSFADMAKPLLSRAALLTLIFAAIGFVRSKRTIYTDILESIKETPRGSPSTLKIGCENILNDYVPFVASAILFGLSMTPTLISSASVLTKKIKKIGS